MKMVEQAAATAVALLFLLTTVYFFHQTYHASAVTIIIFYFIDKRVDKKYAQAAGLTGFETLADIFCIGKDLRSEWLRRLPGNFADK